MVRLDQSGENLNHNDSGMTQGLVKKADYRRCRKFRVIAGAACSLGILGIFASCATPPAPKEFTLEERMREDNRIGDEIAADFESRLNVKRDVEVSVYLRKVAQRLAEVSPELAGAPLGVFLLPDQGGVWKNYGLPGNRIYLSVSVLKGIDFENELAAVIAYELAQIANRLVLTRIQKEGDLRLDGKTSGPVDGVPAMVSGRLRSSLDYFGESGIFSFTDEDRLKAAETAVTIMYRAGYDPRGMVSLWGRLKGFGKHSPYDLEMLEKLTEKSREAIAYFAPLRNPVVRSDAFLSMKRRIERL